MANMSRKYIVLNPGVHPELSHVAVKLEAERMLQAYVTSGSFAADSIIARTMEALPTPESVVRFASRRRLPHGISARRVRNFGFVLELIFKSVHWAPVRVHKPVMLLRTRYVDLRCAVLILFTRPVVVVGQSTGCMLSFLAARLIGARTILNYPLPHHEWEARYMRDEALRNSAWAPYLQTSGAGVFARCILKTELRFSDKVWVASTFAARSFSEVGSRANVEVLPLGVAAVGAPGERKARYRQRREPLNALFVGQVTQRKGISYLIEAIHLAEEYGSSISLRMVGMCFGNIETRLKEMSHVELISSVDPMTLSTIYREADVLVLPSLSDGFGLVILEAMTSGVPVIASRNTAGPDIIRNAIDGYIVPDRDSDAIARALISLERNEDARQLMAEEARLRALNYTWDSYAARASASVRSIAQME